MNDNTALAVRQPQQLNPGIWETITAVAPVMKDSRLFGVSTEAQAMAIMAKGYELGLSLTSAFEFIQVIENKPALTPRGALALVMQSGLLDNLKIDDLKDAAGVPTSCRVTMKRRGGFEYTSEFTMDDAKRAGLVKTGGNWEKYPANMLRWRAVGYCIDVAFSDVCGGMKRADEFGASIDFAGNVVDATWAPVNTATPAPAASEQPAVAVISSNGPVAVLTLQDLVSKFGPEAVMLANDGRIPASDEELAATAAKLAA